MSEPAPTSTPDPTAAAPSSGRGRRILRQIALSVAVLAVLSAAGWWFSRNDVDQAKVGSCFDATVADNTVDADKVKTIDCTDSRARYKIIGIVENKTETAFTADETICDQWPSWDSAVWVGKANSTGRVYCMEQLGTP